VSKDKLSDQTAGRKRKGENIFNAAYGQPANNIIVDETDAPEPSSSPKRNRQEDPLSKLATRANERRKRIKETITSINSSIDQHSNSVDPLPGAVDQLSDPTFEHILAFPFVGFEAPVRFNVDNKAEENWAYAGREIFKKLLKELNEVRDSNVYTSVWLYGTQGYGKSHLLAALVCYLAAQDEQIIYIPDCRALLQDPVRYIRAAMLFAWADDLATQREIMTLNTLGEIQDFFELQENVIFVIDEKNALKSSDDSREDTKHRDLLDWLTRFAFGHKSVFSSSANYEDFHKQVGRKNSNRILPAYSGFTRVSHRRIIS
jgi:hypothetical protein